MKRQPKRIDSPRFWTAMYGEQPLPIGTIHGVSVDWNITQGEKCPGDRIIEMVPHTLNERGAFRFLTQDLGTDVALRRHNESVNNAHGRLGGDKLMNYFDDIMRGTLESAGAIHRIPHARREDTTHCCVPAAL